MARPRNNPGRAARPGRIDGATVRADFNALEAVLLYTRAAHRLGLWQSERLLLERFFPDRGARLLEAGCGSGRVSLALWDLGYRRLAGFDFAEELVAQARSLAAERGAAIGFHVADATRLRPADLDGPDRADPFGGVLFPFNGLMQIPGRRQRRRALRRLAAVAAPGAPLLFTTHDRDEPDERALWARERRRWERGEQDPRLREFGDRYFEHEHGRTFMHLPDRGEILADLAATGWRHEFDAMRRTIARENAAVRDFSDECRFWLARRA